MGCLPHEESDAANSSLSRPVNAICSGVFDPAGVLEGPNRITKTSILNMGVLSNPTQTARRSWVRRIFSGRSIGMFIAIGMVGGIAWVGFSVLFAAKGYADSIRCINNLKNLGLGLRIYATDHEGKYPDFWVPTTNDFYAVGARLLICPSDRHHKAAADWASIGPKSISFEYCGKGFADGEDDRILAICPIHGHLLLGDGSIEQGYTTQRPKVSRRDGGVWYERSRK